VNKGLHTRRTPMVASAIRRSNRERKKTVSYYDDFVATAGKGYVFSLWFVVFAFIIFLSLQQGPGCKRR
jgi:hypothetical protein